MVTPHGHHGISRMKGSEAQVHDGSLYAEPGAMLGWHGRGGGLLGGTGLLASLSSLSFTNSLPSSHHFRTQKLSSLNL